MTNLIIRADCAGDTVTSNVNVDYTAESSLDIDNDGTDNTAMVFNVADDINFDALVTSANKGITITMAMGTAAYTIGGSRRTDVITGNDGANTITGGCNSDVITLGGGSDILVCLSMFECGDLITTFIGGNEGLNLDEDGFDDVGSLSFRSGDFGAVADGNFLVDSTQTFADAGAAGADIVADPDVNEDDGFFIFHDTDNSLYLVYTVNLAGNGAEVVLANLGATAAVLPSNITAGEIAYI